MRHWVALAVSVLATVVAITTWASTAASHGDPPAGHFEPRLLEAWTLTGPDAETKRRELLRRATFRLTPADATRFARVAVAPIRAEIRETLPVCRYLPGEPSGTSAKFDCVFEGGAVVKVKYGRNPEIQAEAAATRLMQLLGYPADSVAIVPRLRCYGCPRYPFMTMQLRSLLGSPFPGGDVDPASYTDFEWVSIERKFPAPAIETESTEGWSWWELDAAGLPRADVDALRLTAMFLAHWDNKASNQRLVCLDAAAPPADGQCARPLALIQDLGATFGPTKVNLARWQSVPVWLDAETCTVSMRAFPFGGASFPDTQIAEAGRAQLAARLAALSDADVRRLFTEARFAAFQPGSDDAAAIDAWVAAFRDRAEQILNARCPEAGGTST